MMRLIRTIARSTYVWAGGDPIELGRIALDSILPDFEGMEAMPESEKRKIYVDARYLLGFKSLTAIISDLIYAQRELIAKRAGKDTLDFARGTLNGLQLTRDRLKSLASKAEPKGGDMFNEFNPI